MKKKVFVSGYSKVLFLMTVGILLFICTPAIWAGPGWMEQQEIHAFDAELEDYFGVAVSISGDLAIVGAPYDDDCGNEAGAAYIFKWDGTNWYPQQKIYASNAAAGARFGQSVSISNGRAIVGAYMDDDNGTDSGSAYVFVWNGTLWVQQQKLIASDGAATDYFGFSVSISGDDIIVGATGDDDNGSVSGSAYIFKWNGVVWGEQQKLITSDGTAYDYFGYSVSISGDDAIVGAYYDTPSGTGSGSAYAFKWDGAYWLQMQKLLPPDGAVNDYFGYSVYIVDNDAIIGAFLNDDNGTDSGSAYVFVSDGAYWYLQQKLLAPDGAVWDYFGISVAIRGDYAIAGAVWDEDNGSQSGSAYIFKRNGTTWGFQQKLLASKGIAGDHFGRAVAISDNNAIMGAYLNDNWGIDAGAAYIFKFCPQADFNNDCIVNLADFAEFAEWWLYGI